MWAPALECQPSHFSPRPQTTKLITIYIVLLLMSLDFTSGQGRFFNHRVDNRSSPDNTVSFVMCSIGKKTEGPEVDPFWYVGRGVRPIGRFGKRHLQLGQNGLRPDSSTLDFILNALREHGALGTDVDDW